MKTRKEKLQLNIIVERKNNIKQRINVNMHLTEIHIVVCLKYQVDFYFEYC